MVDYLEVNVKPDAASIRVAGPALRALPANISSPNNVLGVLDAMQADLFSALWVQMTIWDEVAKKMRPTTLVAEWTAGSLCRANPLVNGPLNTTCDGDTDVRRIVRWYGVDGAYKEGSAFIAPFNTTLINVFIAIRDSVMCALIICLHFDSLTCLYALDLTSEMPTIYRIYTLASPISTLLFDPTRFFHGQSRL